ncbi:MAG TPA: UvrB/UvrC motif-containing protein [Acidobacteriaceae bacterium]|nr:UvrB/UvrC motif-containing protein [Acidobacteriaceae bacterium]
MPDTLLTETLAFDPAEPEAALRQLPQRQAVFALYGESEAAEPYIGLTPNLRRRLERLLRPATTQTKRLQLVSRVRRIAWRVTGSDFESLLVQFSLLEKAYGAKALERMKLRAPAFVKFHGGNPYPRVTVTNRPGLKEQGWAFGPFPSRAAAERYADEALKLFLLRRCEENLAPYPEHPGCVYGEMKMCLAPCQMACSDARYAEEAEAVREFLATRGESRIQGIRAERDKASEELEFEAAAKLHAQLEKVEGVRGMAAELVRPMNELRAVIFQGAAEAGDVAVFLYQEGEMRGPAAFSTLGMRIQNEQAAQSSLYIAPMAIAPVPEGEGAAAATRDVLEARLEGVLDLLSKQRPAVNGTVRQGHLALLTRWYYRPQQKRVGEICFPVEGTRDWPLRSMLRSVGRVAAPRVGKERGVAPGPEASNAAPMTEAAR